MDIIRIAHIDDNEDYLFALKRKIKTYNKTADTKIVVYSYANGMDFWKAFLANPEQFSLVLMDIELGSESGYDIAKRIYSNSTHDILPVVMILSTHVDKDDSFMSLVNKEDLNIEDIMARFTELAVDDTHRNMSDVMLRAEDFSNKIGHAYSE